MPHGLPMLRVPAKVDTPKLHTPWMRRSKAVVPGTSEDKLDLDAREGPPAGPVTIAQRLRFGLELSGRLGMAKSPVEVG